MAKQFKKPTDLFISSDLPDTDPGQIELDKQTKPIKEEPPTNIPAGYRLTKEAKTDRLQILVRPTTHEALKVIAEQTDISKNELINEAIEKYINNYGTDK